VADDYIEIKDLSVKDNNKKSTKKGSIEKKPRRRKKKADYTWLWIVLILAVMAVVLVVVFNQPGVDEAEIEETTPAEGVAAIVNNEQIISTQVDELYDRVPEVYRSVYKKSLILDQLINEKLLVQEAKRKGFTVIGEEVDEAIDKLKLQLQAGQTLDEVLEAQGLSITEFRGLVEEDVLKQKLIDEMIVSSVIISEDNLKDYFDKIKTDDMEFDDVKDQIEDVLRSEKQSTLLEVYLDELREQADIELLMYQDEESEENELADDADSGDADSGDADSEDTEETPEEEVEEGFVTDLTAEETCVGQYGVPDDAVVYYYSNSCPYCATMAGFVQKLETEGSIFYWADNDNEEQSAVIEECFDLELVVPQFVCAKTGEVKVGTLKESSLRAFAQGCN